MPAPRSAALLVALLASLPMACASGPPTDVELLKTEARWAYHQGRPTEALRALRRAAEVAPRDAEAFRLLGRFALESGRPEEAELALSRAIELAPRDPDLRVARGLALRRLRRYEEAERALLHALLLQPAHLPTLVSLAEVYRLSEQPEKCMARYGQFAWQLSRTGEAGDPSVGSRAGALRRAQDRERYCHDASPGAQESLRAAEALR